MGILAKLARPFLLSAENERLIAENAALKEEIKDLRREKKYLLGAISKINYLPESESKEEAPEDPAKLIAEIGNKLAKEFLELKNGGKPDKLGIWARAETMIDEKAVN